MVNGQPSRHSSTIFVTHFVRIFGLAWAFFLLASPRLSSAAKWIAGLLFVKKK
jgi:hypothetical protein